MSAKLLLKKARESIDAKDFRSALKLSKDLLINEESNYVALVYAGLSCVELRQYDEAEAFYKKAVSVQPSTLLAWQGFARLYEQRLVTNASESKTIECLAQVFCKLLTIDNDPAKILQILDKIEKLQPHRNDPVIKDIVKILSDLVDNEKHNAEIKEKAQSLIMKYLSENDKFADDYIDLYEKCYSDLYSQLNINHHCAFFKAVYDSGNFAKILQTNVLDVLKSDQKGRNLMCETFIDEHISKSVSDHCLLLFNHLQELIDVLSTDLNKESRLAKVILRLTTNSSDYLSIKNELLILTNEHPSFIQAHILLADIFIKLELYQEAINTAKMAQKLLKLSSNTNCQTIIDRLFCLSLLSSNDVEEINEAIVLVENLNNPCDQISTAMIYALIKLDKLEEADLWLDKLRTNVEKFIIAKAAIFKHKNLLQDALSLLSQVENNEEHCYEYWLMLGDLYWEIREQETNTCKCLASYLKATKANPVSYVCYLKLGRFYEARNDFDKARRCYEKSVSIKGTKCAYLELSKIYRKLRKYEENHNLLLNLTSGNITQENSWAFLQLGIHYYEQEEFLQAINSLRYVIRTQPENRFCWETLGDCYFSSGAYTSALKCYMKAKTLEPSVAVYAMLQVAHIKKLVGEYVEARDEFQIVLEMEAKYLPALTGIAETYFMMAKQFYNQQLYGLARDHLQRSIEHAAEALEVDPSLSCCWKIAGDCCYLASLLPFKCSFLIVILPDLPKSDAALFGEELAKSAIDAYCKALPLPHANKIAIYYDLACCYVRYAKLSLDIHVKEERLNYAMAIIKHCIDANANSAKYWNLLGIVCSNMKNRYSLAQHAFIKAVSLDRNNAESWTNLGALYLQLKQLKLANEVFAQAQKTNPNYVQSWIGQALVAEASNMEEAMDLFRHTMELAYHPEGTIGYANWVCETLRNKQSDEVIYSIDNMHAIPVACDGLRWYVVTNEYPSFIQAHFLLADIFIKLEHYQEALNTAKMAQKVLKLSSNTNYQRIVDRLFCLSLLSSNDVEEINEAIVLVENLNSPCYQISTAMIVMVSDANNPHDACAWNMFGYLNERLGLNSGALDAYQRATKYANNTQSISNLGRVFTNLQMYDEAIACFQTISERSRTNSIVYALALFKAGDYQTAYEIYESVLEDVPTNCKSLQSDLLVALASMLYMFQGPENAKELLFQSTQLRKKSAWSLYAVASLGLLEDDLNLAKLALNEIEKLPNDEEHLNHFSKLLLYNSLLQGDYKQGISKISRLIHMFPSSSSLWLNLSTLLYRTRKDQRMENNTIAKCAQSSLKLKANDTSNLTMVLPIVCATSILSNDLRNALKNAARFVHFYPDNKCANATLQFVQRLSHSAAHLISST